MNLLFVGECIYPSKTFYVPCRYTPVRSDSVIGELRLSEPSDIVLPGIYLNFPLSQEVNVLFSFGINEFYLNLLLKSTLTVSELPRIEVLALTGKAVEGQILTALEVIPKDENQQLVWGKYKKEVRYQW